MKWKVLWDEFAWWYAEKHGLNQFRPDWWIMTERIYMRLTLHRRCSCGMYYKWRHTICLNKRTR